ncbi:NADH dehydrogenase [ubiquinone] 1 beta subcomplex subunit 4 [Agrilus planipennis]|uniref:NADH dehydrogenase [ubiquinone] 1 beta subcomplex subunit 4 n=1 Tax=Agrilus planipennis TaxID=224129 RepID=A0A1W4X571_AGRPL|nr:NADH dehydrogenase [ubiquinone] 1 beta subcomplex subunit 4 [Agrilus planipennis]
MSTERYYPQDEQEKLIEKSKRRAFLREEFLKQTTNPFRHATGEGGTVFDPAIQRYSAMIINQYDYFRPTPKTSFMGIVLIVIPFCSYWYLLKTTREKREQQYRSGEIPYSKRLFKFI